MTEHDWHPTKIIAVHLNYRSRASDRGMIPDVPSYFLKPPSSLGRDGGRLVRPQGCELMVFEGEIAVVIGVRARDVDPGCALDYVRGYAAANDAGVLDLREVDRGSSLRSKGQDGFTPVARALLPASLDPQALVVRTYVNGELRQDSAGDPMIFPVAQLIADLSRTMTLEPGDIILTGTPTGSGVARPGDRITVEVSTAPGAAEATSRVSSVVEEAAAPLKPYGAMPAASDDDRRRAGALPPALRNAPLPAQTLAILRRVATATLASQLSRRGLASSCIDGVRPGRPGQRMVGFARTLRYLPVRADVSARIGGAGNAQKAAVDSLQAGEVLVIDARGRADAGTIGDILVQRALQRGAAGVVTDGAVRDALAVEALPLPVFHRGRHPAPLSRAHVPADMDLPVTCGGALVMPGDVLVGDADGVVVIPREMADEIALAADQQEQEELFIAERVSAGAPVLGLYPMDAESRRGYERWLGDDAANDAATTLPQVSA